MQLQREMFALVSEWRASGMSKKAFLADRNIRLSKFNYWCTKYSDEHHGADLPAENHFRELVLSKSAPETPAKVVELTTPTGLHIVIYG